MIEMGDPFRNGVVYLQGSALLLALSFAFSPSGWANALFFETSDIHGAAKDHVSGLRTAEAYVRASASLTVEFHRRTGATSPVIHLINGDTTGGGMWSIRDRGEGMWNFIAEFSAEHELVVNVGNHEGTDYAPDSGNVFMLAQNRRFLARANSRRGPEKAPLRYTVGNLVPAPEARDQFQSFYDQTLPGGKRLRVLSYVLDTLLGESSYRPKAQDPVQVWEQVLPMLETAKRQIQEAADEGVRVVVIQCHERFSIVRRFVDDLLKWKAENPQLDSIKIPLAFAAHDHRVLQEQIGDTHVFDSGTEFTFTMAEISDDGDFVQAKYMGRKEQKEVAAPVALLSEADKRAIATLDPEINALEPVYGRPLGFTQAYSETRAILEQGRGLVGIRIADALRQWGLDSWKELSQTDVAGRLPKKIEGALALYNTGSYRLAEPIQEGTLTYGHIVQIMPFSRSWGLVVMKGSDVETMYKAIHESQKKLTKVYTPQISSNLRETEQSSLEVMDETGGSTSWGAIRPDGDYVVALEGWIDMNGYRLPEVEGALKRAIRLRPRLHDAHEIMEKYFPAEFEKKTPCTELLVKHSG